MDALFFKDIENKEKGLRIFLHKEDIEITQSGQDIVFKIVDNQYDSFPKVTLSPQDAQILAEELLEMIHYHKRLLHPDILETAKKRK